MTCFISFPGPRQIITHLVACKNGNLFSPSSGGQMSEIVSAGLHSLQRLLGKLLPVSSRNGGSRSPLVSLFACSHITPISDCLFTSPSPLLFLFVFCVSLISILVFGFRGHLDNPKWAPHLETPNYICKDFFLIKPCFQTLGKSYRHLWEGHGSTH